MTDALLAGNLPLRPRLDYLRHGTTVASWLTTTDHKRIAILYAVTITIFFFMGGAAITLVRLELFTPNGGLLSSDTYNKLFSFHGIVMVWFFLVPSIPNTMGAIAKMTRMVQNACPSGFEKFNVVRRIIDSSPSRYFRGRPCASASLTSYATQVSRRVNGRDGEVAG